jgi:hypothetical protein
MLTMTLPSATRKTAVTVSHLGSLVQIAATGIAVDEHSAVPNNKVL